jgi:hypothetical protein
MKRRTWLGMGIAAIAAAYALTGNGKSSENEGVQQNYTVNPAEVINPSLRERLGIEGDPRDLSTEKIRELTDLSNELYGQNSLRAAQILYRDNTQINVMFSEAGNVEDALNQYGLDVSRPYELLDITSLAKDGLSLEESVDLLLPYMENNLRNTMHNGKTKTKEQMSSLGAEQTYNSMVVFSEGDKTYAAIHNAQEK